MPRLAVEDEKRMVHMLPVVAVVARAFLLTVGGLVGRVEIHKHLLGSAAAPASLREVEFEEHFGYLAAGASGG